MNRSKPGVKLSSRIWRNQPSLLQKQYRSINSLNKYTIINKDKIHSTKQNIKIYQSIRNKKLSLLPTALTFHIIFRHPFTFLFFILVRLVCWSHRVGLPEKPATSLLYPRENGVGCFLIPGPRETHCHLRGYLWHHAGSGTEHTSGRSYQ